jgi:hypothetical protein
MTRDYHDQIDIVSASMLKLLRNDPVEYYDTYVEPDPKKRRHRPSTVRMDVGSIVHDVALDDKPLRSIVGVYPEHDEELGLLKGLTAPKRDKLDLATQKRLAKLCGVSHDDFMAAKGGKPLNSICCQAGENVVGQSGNLISKAAEAFRKEHPEYRYFLKQSGSLDGGKVPSVDSVRAVLSAIQHTDIYKLIESDRTMKESPLYWTDPYYGLKCRCKPDIHLVLGNVGYAWDLKITEFAADYEPHMNKMLNHLQKQHYSAGMKAVYGVDEVKFVFVAVKPSYPFHVCEYEFALEDEDRIEEDYQRTMHNLWQRQKNNDWQLDASRQVNEVRFWKRSEFKCQKN